MVHVHFKVRSLDSDSQGGWEAIGVFHIWKHATNEKQNFVIDNN